MTESSPGAAENPRSLKHLVRLDLEPEDCIADALYLLQLCQQDLNMGRKETVWPRAMAAKDLCAALEAMFEPNRSAEGRGSNT